MSKGFRQGRLAEEIRKIISELLLKEIKDPRLSGFISISDVEVTRDSSYATCYVTILDISKDEEKKKERENEVLEGLNSAKGMMRTYIGREIKMRRVPELIFKPDHSQEYGSHIDEVLRGLEYGDNE